MRIALDYDGTYTLDPEFWDGVIRLAVERNHKVVVVTMRYPNEKLDRTPWGIDQIIYTGRKAKVPFMSDLGMKIDIWIDDMPWFLLNGSN